MDPGLSHKLPLAPNMATYRLPPTFPSVRSCPAARSQFLPILPAPQHGIEASRQCLLLSPPPPPQHLGTVSVWKPGLRRACIPGAEHMLWMDALAPRFSPWHLQLKGSQVTGGGKRSLAKTLHKHCSPA